MPPRVRKAVLASVPEDDEVVGEGGEPGSSTPPLPAELRSQYKSLEAQLETRIAEIWSATEDAVLGLQNECRRQLVKLPKSVRSMTLARLREELPDDYSAAGLREVQEKLASLAAPPPLAPGTRARGTVRKRAAGEPTTVLRTVQTRRMAARTGDEASGPAGPPLPAPRPGADQDKGSGGDPAPKDSTAAAPGPPGRPPVPPRRGGAAPPRAAAPAGTLFNGLPLATPLPFSGPAVQMPITYVTEQKRAGGRFTAAAAPPSAVVLQAASGAQYAVSRLEDLEGLPGGEADALLDSLRAQREFLDRLLANSINTRRGGRGRK
ncbi:hypothetical protein ACKKBG_A08925 [Auxenochlorella protothecoides x Auxenochlorella symbiontica]